MSNFHTNEWIQEKVMEHLEEAKEHFTENHIVGIFLQGSQNYGMDYINSDIDTKLIITPTLEDLVYNNAPVSTTHVRKNNEHIDFKDIRLYVQTFRKQNLNFLEILFTDYFWINPVYLNEWGQLVNIREDIAHLNPYLAVKAMQGVAKEKYFALEHNYPSQQEAIITYGYASKQLHHLLRVEKYLQDYISGKTYNDCLHPDESFCEYLVNIKNDNTYYSLDEARKISEKAIDNIDEICKNYFKIHSNEINVNTDNILKKVQYTIVKKSIINDLNTSKE